MNLLKNTFPPEQIIRVDSQFQKPQDPNLSGKWSEKSWKKVGIYPTNDLLRRLADLNGIFQVKDTRWNEVCD